MSEDRETVELPADPRIKQLAHDICRNGHGDRVDFLLDFYEFISTFDEDEHVELSDTDLASPTSPLSSTIFRGLIDELTDQDVIERHHGGSTTYTWKYSESGDDS